MLNDVSSVTSDKVKSNKILALSGGGVKGIAELVVLTEIEERTGKSISELFPIITGTSVGGLIAALLTIPKEYGSIQPKYSAKDALQIFKDAAPKIFENHWYDTLKQIFTHKHSQGPLKQVLDDHLSELRLDSTTSRLIIPVTDLTNENTEIMLFDSHDSYSRHIRVRDVLLATTAAPTYFKPVTNNQHIAGYANKQDVLYAYADGGLGANRPASEAIKRLKEGHTRQETVEILNDTMVVSLNFDTDLNARNAIPALQRDGLLGWGIPLLSKGKLIDRLLAISEQKATSEVLGDLPGLNEFIEIKLPINHKTSSLDDASADNIRALEEIGRQYIQDHEEQVSKLCDILVYNYHHECDVQNNANDEPVVDQIVVDTRDTLERAMMSQDLAQQLAINLNERQITTIKSILSGLSEKESGMTKIFLEGLNSKQIVALANELPIIADGKTTDSNILEFSTFQNKFLNLLSQMLINYNEFVQEVPLCYEEYQNEVECDGRGSKSSHHIDISVES